MVIVRDEEWLVTNTEQTTSGTLVRCIGLSELVRDTPAAFYSELDKIEVLDSSQAKVVADASSQYRDARLWLEATLRRQPIPTLDPRLTVSTQMLATPLNYQLTAVKRALDPEKLRPRLLIADAVGLGKTIEIGMILSELVRRGQGERILIVTPRHVLEQMQREMWTRFALPFVRLDSVGLQRVRQQLPATRNPFSYFKRAIISIDTLKQDQYRAHLQKFHWDAVVIDESHNITGATLNNRLARTLAPNTHALILASATPHNGKAESFAELIRLLEPSAVAADNTFDEDAVKRLVLRRHRHSPEVQSEVGADWAERKEPQNLLIEATPSENNLADHLAHVWLNPNIQSPYSGKNKGLFPWTLAKAFLSSPVAFRDTVRDRMKRLNPDNPEQARELKALQELDDLVAPILEEGSAKLTELIRYLKQIGVGKRKQERAVVFSERVATLHWLREALKQEFNFGDDEIRVLHGQLTDVEQQEVVEEFKQASSKLRVLVTGDVASEGVNLHAQCHELIHFDIPWSLIRIEQRNGRIDRFGQRTPPQITTLLLDFDNDEFAGDVRVLSRLIDREHEAHKALGDTASLMGKYDTDSEEEEIRKVLAGAKAFDEVVRSPEDVLAGDDGVDAFLATLFSTGSEDPAEVETATNDETIPPTGLFSDTADFLRTGLATAYTVPGATIANNGVGFEDKPQQRTLSVTPPRDLTQRLRVLPQSYLQERKVTEKFTVTTSQDMALASLEQAQNSPTSISSWPAEHYLGPLHPLLDWVADKTLSKLGRNEVFAVRGDVMAPTVYLLATVADRQARTISSMHLTQTHAGESRFFSGSYADAHSALASLGVSADASLVNPGPVAVDELQGLIAPAVEQSLAYADSLLGAIGSSVEQRVEGWLERLDQWQQNAKQLAQRQELTQRRDAITDEEQLAEAMRPHHMSVRPLLVVVPTEYPTGEDA
ncbi:DEAD/DEAH box helicase [Gulosibacter chungangensis]|uniref:DEAD/DEAH box helicase n=1 Tax=Gulosibacter chungangensis TaxID=979746 RepID=A0A7J5BC30_9MICO|nr:DEAD/DEAH box helicase [Gulosibacter chungangensis]